MSRIRNSIKNMRVNLFFYLLYTFIGFFSRKIFLEYLGDEFVGLIGTLQSILGFLNLAELGIGTAIGFYLYKPLYDDDKKALNKIVALLGFLYKRIALIILLVGIITSFFFGYFFSGTSFSLILILYCFYSFLFSALLGYLINYHQTLLQADQKEYMITSYLQTSNIIRQILQASIAYYFENLYVWISLELFFSVVYSIIIRWVIKRQYPWLVINEKFNKGQLSEYREVIVKVKQIFVHRIATFINYGTDQFLIFYFVSIESVAFYGNYYLIFNMLQQIVGKLFTGINASVGNLIAENNPKQIDKVFWEMISLRFFLGSMASLNIYYLVHSFIYIWIGEKYLLENDIIILMTFNFFIGVIRLPIDSFLHAYGLYKDTWAPTLEIILNLVVSISLGSIYGIKGIIFGTTVSVCSILFLWKPYYLYNSGFGKSVLKHFWPDFLKFFIILGISIFLIHTIKSSFLDYRPDTYVMWVKYALLLNVIILIIFVPLMFLFGKGFKNLVWRIVKLKL